MSTVRLIRVTGAVVILFIAMITMGVLAFLAGPQIEGSLFPIMRADHVAGSVKWKADSLCWSVHYMKFRNDAPAYFNYRIRYPRSNERVPLAVYRIDRETGQQTFLSTFGFANHAKDSNWVADYCADLPRNLSLTRPFLIEGEGFYQSWHRLWLVPQDLPDFIVDQEQEKLKSG
jgi:hypothetical protein